MIFQYRKILTTSDLENLQRDKIYMINDIKITLYKCYQFNVTDFMTLIARKLINFTFPVP